MSYDWRHPFCFTKQAEEEIADALRRHGHSAAERKIPEFLKELEFNLAFYLALPGIDGSLEKTSNIRRNIERLRKCIDDSLTALNQMGVLSQGFLTREYVNGIDDFRRQLKDMSVAVDCALSAANNLPNKRGSTWRSHTSKHVAKCMRDCLCVEPTGTKHSIFDDILTIIFEAIGHPLADVNRLACETVAQLTQQSEI
ncbi:MAG: hypothetical protein ACR2KU_08335 [Gammaproteobacteria bacterium]